MNSQFSDFKHARDEVSASSAGGAPFLIGYGTTFITTGILSFFFDREVSALIVMFQGAVALPISFWLERRMGSQRMSLDNPLRQLSVQMAVSQAFALPFIIVAYNINPSQIPVVMAGLGGVHFLPYAWLHRTRIYAVLAALVSIGSFALLLVFQSKSYEYILFFVGAVYWIAVPLVYRHARNVISE